MSVRVRLIDTTRDFPDEDLMIPDHTTFGEFCEDQDISTATSSVRVRKHGEVINLKRGDLMESGMKITVTPTSIKGS